MEYAAPTSTLAPASKPRKREIELDFIRGLAILMVLDYHSGDPVLLYPFILLGFPHFGWVGVNIFFVLSGFLVGGLLINEWKVRGRIDAKRFLVRRGFKIWPQYYFFLFLNLITAHRAPTKLWANFLNIQNYVHGTIPHTWSLAVEEHAYILLLLCLGIAASRKSRMLHVFQFLACCAICVFIIRLVSIYRGIDVFPLTHTRIDGIIYGVLLAIILHYSPDTFRSLQDRRWLWLAALGCALLYFRFFNESVPWMLSVSWDFGSLTGVALLMLLYAHGEERNRPAIYRFVAWIGIYSYGIYLWHIATRAPSVGFADRLPHWLRPAWILIIPPTAGIVLGIVATKLVEFPALKLRDRLFPPRVHSPLGVSATSEVSKSQSKQVATLVMH